jgi:hypothetical protein
MLKKIKKKKKKNRQKIKRRKKKRSKSKQKTTLESPECMNILRSYKEEGLTPTP